VFGIQFGESFPQWGTFVAALTMVIGLITVYVRGMPERHRVRNEEKKLRDDHLITQIAEFRKEVHGYRNELQVVHRELEKSESRARRRADRIVALTVVVQLVMSEIKRLDPNSLILAQAETLLAKMVDEDTKPETTAQAARQTLEAAERTVAKIEGTEP
jgi:hypothetical protein